MDDEEEKHWKCDELDEVLRILKENDGNTVVEKGLQNYKMPDAVFFMKKPINIACVENYIKSQEDLDFEEDDRRGRQSIWCKTHYIEIIYEPEK